MSRIWVKATASEKATLIQRLQVQEERLGQFLVCVGLLCVVFSVGYPIALAETAPVAPNPIHIDKNLLSQTTPVEEIPSRIVIPTLDIDLPVTPSRVIDGYWELSETTASYGLGSSHPGENGNVVIFAHARKGLFLPLRNIQKEADVYVLTRAHWYVYKVADIKSVDPSDTSVIAQTIRPTLTLYTCSGFVDEKRLIVTATPKEVDVRAPTND